MLKLVPCLQPRDAYSLTKFNSLFNSCSFDYYKVKIQTDRSIKRHIFPIIHDNLCCACAIHEFKKRPKCPRNSRNASFPQSCTKFACMYVCYSLSAAQTSEDIHSVNATDLVRIAKDGHTHEAICKLCMSVCLSVVCSM